MSTSRLRAGIAGLGLAAGLLVISTPAGALDQYLDCTPATNQSGNSVYCDLSWPGTTSNQRWTTDGSYDPYADNQASIQFACGATGARWTVAVTYTDSVGGQHSESTWGTCGSMPI